MPCFSDEPRRERDAVCDPVRAVGARRGQVHVLPGGEPGAAGVVARGRMEAHHTL